MRKPLNFWTGRPAASRRCSAPPCETLVHDMGDPSHPILSIYNGHVSGRTVGSTLDILGTAKELDEDALVTDFVNLYATTPSGPADQEQHLPPHRGGIQPGPWHQLRLQLPGVRQPHSGGPHERGGPTFRAPCGTAGTAVWPMSLTSVWPPLASRSAP